MPVNKRSSLPKGIGTLINTIKRLEKRLKECSENEIIILCLSKKIDELLNDVLSEESE